MLNQPKLLETENRHFARQNCQWTAVLTTETATHSCIVEDIGIGGCRLIAESCDVSPEMEVTIQIPERDMIFKGQIVWSKLDEIGVKFIHKPDKL